MAHRRQGWQSETSQEGSRRLSETAQRRLAERLGQERKRQEAKPDTRAPKKRHALTLKGKEEEVVQPKRQGGAARLTSTGRRGRKESLAQAEEESQTQGAGKGSRGRPV